MSQKLSVKDLYYFWEIYLLKYWEVKETLLKLKCQLKTIPMMKLFLVIGSLVQTGKICTVIVQYFDIDIIIQHHY